MTHYLTADLHFGHHNIIPYCNRPFRDIDDMASSIIKNWNSIVRSDEDIVWVLGDLSIDSKWELALELSRSLRGRLRLITGNHDRGWIGKSDFMKYMPKYQERFELVSPWARLKINGDNFKMCHFPYSWDTSDDRATEYRLPASPGVLLCGHVHNAWKSKKNKDSIMVNVGVDVWDYRPVDIGTVIRFIRDTYPNHPAVPKEPA